jgi:ribosomal protein S15P/S13E
MTCSEVEKILPEIMDGAPDGEYRSAFEGHLKSCPVCAELVSDLKLISTEAKNLRESDDPPAYLWQEIAAQLRAEGVIREEPQRTWGPVLVPARPVRRWSAWWLAPVAACLVAGGAYVIQHHPAAQVAKNTATVPVTAPAPVATNVPEATTEAQAQKPATVIAPTSTAPTKPAVAKKSNSGDVVELAKIPKTEQENTNEAAPTAEDQQFLSVVSTRAPSMRASVESQLQAVNEDIREVQEYLARNPRDVDARQQLMDAYQKKALLYQIALDRIQ